MLLILVYVSIWFIIFGFQFSDVSVNFLLENNVNNVINFDILEFLYVQCLLLG